MQSSTDVTTDSDTKPYWNLEMLVFEKEKKRRTRSKEAIGARTRTNKKLHPQYMTPRPGFELEAWATLVGDERSRHHAISAAQFTVNGISGKSKIDMAAGFVKLTTVQPLLADTCMIRTLPCLYGQFTWSPQL